MYFKSDVMAIDEMAEFSGVPQEILQELLDSKLISVDEEGNFDVVSYVQILIMSDLIRMNVSDGVLGKVSQMLDNRGFGEQNIGFIPFAVAYAKTSKYVRLMIYTTEDVVIELGTTQHKIYVSHEHGTYRIPYIGTPPKWGSVWPCMMYVYFDMYIQGLSKKIKIDRISEGVNVRFLRRKK